MMMMMMTMMLMYPSSVRHSWSFLSQLQRSPGSPHDPVSPQAHITVDELYRQYYCTCNGYTHATPRIINSIYTNTKWHLSTIESIIHTYLAYHWNEKHAPADSYRRSSAPVSHVLSATITPECQPLCSAWGRARRVDGSQMTAPLDQLTARRGQLNEWNQLRNVHRVSGTVHVAHGWVELAGAFVALDLGLRLFNRIYTQCAKKSANRFCFLVLYSQWP